MNFIKIIFLTTLLAAFSANAMAEVPTPNVRIEQSNDFLGFFLFLETQEGSKSKIVLEDEFSHVLYEASTSKKDLTFSKKFVLDQLPKGTYSLTIINEAKHTYQPFQITMEGLVMDENKQVQISTPEIVQKGDKISVDFQTVGSLDVTVFFIDTEGETVYSENVNTGNAPRRLYNLTELKTGDYKVFITYKDYSFYQVFAVK